MLNALISAGQQALMKLDPEKAHGLSISALKSGLFPRYNQSHGQALEVKLAGLSFPNPIGLAAGYDKNGEVPDAILRLGFGFSEIGTITPLPQSGNPKPRVFRLSEHEGVINRLGFNNEGHDAALSRLEARHRAGKKGIVGVNIGANKDSDDFVEDYVTGIKTFSHLASYFTANISSPNTPGLRNLQAGEALTRLLERMFDVRAGLDHQPPIFLKLAPDLNDETIKEIAGVIAKSHLSGVMISNTTLSRTGVENHHHASEAGGLSGKPLLEASTIVLARFREQLPHSIPLIGIGGVGDADSAWQKFEAGASLVQLYSRMVYEGPYVANRICQGLIKRMDDENINSISQLTGRSASQWAKKSLV